MTTHTTVGPGRGADRPSCLAINPRNREASAERRRKLLAAFDALPPDTRADLLEAAETQTLRMTSGYFPDIDEMRRIIRQAYVAAGWDA